MKNILPAPAIEITRTIREKIFIVLWTWFLLVFVYQNILYKFILELNQTGRINFGNDFDPVQLIWGEHIFPNIIKIIVDLAISLLGGITVGYLITKARITFKFFYSLLSALVQFFFYILTLLIILAVFNKSKPDEGVGVAFFYFIESFRLQPLYAVFLGVGLVLVFLGYYYGISLGIYLREENSFGTDFNRRDTFLDIKWYHWLWFWIPVGIYFKIMLWIAFSGFSAIFETLRGWGILGIFGFTVSSGNGDTDQSIYGIIFWGFLIIAFFFIQLQFVWNLLTGKKIIKNKLVSGILIFIFSFIVPVVIIFLFYWLYHRK
jgi:hypothetical protein